MGLATFTRLTCAGSVGVDGTVWEDTAAGHESQVLHGATGSTVHGESRLHTFVKWDTKSHRWTWFDNVWHGFYQISTVCTNLLQISTRHGRAQKTILSPDTPWETLLILRSNALSFSWDMTWCSSNHAIYAESMAFLSLLLFWYLSTLSILLSSHLSNLPLLSMSHSARAGSPRISPRASHWRASAGPIRWWPWATHRWRAALPRRSPTRRSRCHRTKSAAPRPRRARRPRHRLRPDPATETWHHLLPGLHSLHGCDMLSHGTVWSLYMSLRLFQVFYIVLLSNTGAHEVQNKNIIFTNHLAQDDSHMPNDLQPKVFWNTYAVRICKLTRSTRRKELEIAVLSSALRPFP